jgi:hypothetical protein
VCERGGGERGRDGEINKEREGIDGREIDRGERGCECGVERYNEGECKRGEGGRVRERRNYREREREIKKEGEEG